MASLWLSLDEFGSAEARSACRRHREQAGGAKGLPESSEKLVRAGDVQWAISVLCEICRPSAALPINI